MPPSSETRAPRLTFGRSLGRIVSKLSCSFFSKTQTPPQPLNQPFAFPPIPQPRSISRPRQLRRARQANYPIPHDHPINGLPVEILAFIFELGAEQDTFFPITVSHVCRDWRQIALQTPSLWRCITLGPEERMWRERIRRAHACPLDIQLLPSRWTRSGIRRPQDLNPYTVNWYMQIAHPYIRQWRSLDVRFSEYSPYLWKAALAGCASPAPTLHELSLVYRLNDDIQEFLLFAAYAPSLRRLTVDGIRLAWMPSLFANLTFLDYTHHGFTSGHQAVYDITSILSVSSRLVELRLLFPRGQIARLPPRLDSVTKRVALPYLTQLHLRVDGSDIPFELAHLVTLISTPSVTTLQLVDLSRSHHSFPSLKSFFYIYALPPTLRFVCIGHGWYDPRMIHAMSHSLPHLVRIHVKRSRTADQVFNMKGRVRKIPSSGSVGYQTFAQTHDRFYHIDRPNVRYFPGYKVDNP
ncbi:hypothetical protein BDZ97DRAFT_914389 [Flammula alnicola]|nr:hypothetical protein BDZ97DRAFT_914389 [Flammula alnicola]